ncbi:MAG TPA: GspE/PulE family protein [Opitutaceae bacterium]|nr:GspE/PulE family protein [Opitutaceae bacterium]
MPPTTERTARPREEHRLPADGGVSGGSIPQAVTANVGFLAPQGGVAATGASADVALRAFGESLAMPVLAAADLVPEPSALAVVTRETAQRATALPLQLRGTVLRLAVADPFADELESFAQAAQLALEPVLAPAAAIRDAIDRYYAAATPNLASAAAVGRAPDESTGDDAPIAKLVQHLVEEAIRRRASDIHVEPLAKRLRIRLRIDGELQETDAPPRQVQAALISRLKLMARMGLDERRVPQDGRIQLTVAGHAVDLRASCLPAIHGESIVLRVLESTRLALDWASLGLWRDDAALLERAVGTADGLVLVTGPTGSGKTTTLYSCLQRLNCADRKIVTVEDPIEYQLAGINQVPVRPEAGMTFAAALRALLRQAPNIIMVGEIRDRETAEIALNAAQTGHLVFSTLHTNDTVGAIARLVDLGAKPYLLAATLRAVVAQRLVRRICPGCARPVEPSAVELLALGASAEVAATANWRRGVGCPECLGSGYRGRLGIYEILAAGEELRRMIYDNVTAAQLRASARRLGMRTLREDGLRKTLAGWTTIGEILAHTVGDSC